MTPIETAELLMDDPAATREQVQAAHDTLKAWHDANHPATCTCHAWLVLDLLQFDLLVWVEGVPRLVGAERRSATNRLLNAILGKNSF